MTRRATSYVLLALGAFVVGLLGTILAFREPTEPLTFGALEAAERRWAAAGIDEYDVAYRMHGSVYEVEVRDGIVMDIRVDGGNARTSDPGLYSVPGIFETLRMELENFADASGPSGGRGHVLMRVRLNERFGYVERYLRSAGGAGRGVAIELLEFRAAGDSVRSAAGQDGDG